MKFIGQHIQQFIARFRADVYLEGVTESAQDHIVGIDADGKLYKQDVPVGDITGVTAGDALIGGGTSGTVTINHEDTSSQASVDNSGSTFIQDVTLDTYGHVTGLTSVAVPTLNQDTTGTAATVTAAAQTNITSLGTLTSLQVDNTNINGSRITLIGDAPDGCIIDCSTHGATTITTVDIDGAAANLGFVVDGAITTDSTSFTAATDAFSIISGTAGKPELLIINNNTDTKPPEIILQKTATGGASDGVGLILFIGDDDADNEHTYAGIQSQIVSAANNSEAGKISFEVATSAGSGTANKVGILISGSATANDIDVTIGAETTSLTTIAGDLQVNGNDIKDSGGNAAITFDGSGNTDIRGNLAIRGAESADDVRINFEASDGSNRFTIESDLDGTTNNDLLGFRSTSTDDILVLKGDGNISTSSNLTVGGNLTATKRKFTIPGNTDGTHDGDVVFIGGTTSMTTGAIYHYNSSGNWELADADDNTKSDGLLGVALGAASDTNGVLLRGMVTLDHDPGAVGDVLFLSTTAGDCSSTAPSGNGNIVRIIGYCLDASNGQVWFNPDNTFVEYAT